MTGKADEGRAQLAGVAAQAARWAFSRAWRPSCWARPRLPAPAAPLTADEREAARATRPAARAAPDRPRAAPEGLREWNFSMRGMSDRQLRAAAQEACDREVWDRCISASERTRSEFDLTQRFPTPYRQALLATSREVGVDPSYVTA